MLLEGLEAEADKDRVVFNSAITQSGGVAGLPLQADLGTSPSTQSLSEALPSAFFSPDSLEILQKKDDPQAIAVCPQANGDC